MDAALLEFLRAAELSEVLTFQVLFLVVHQISGWSEGSLDVGKRKHRDTSARWRIKRTDNATSEPSKVQLNLQSKPPELEAKP